MITVLALINTKPSVDMVVVFGDSSGGFGFLTRSIADFMLVTHPAALRFKVFV